MRKTTLCAILFIGCFQVSFAQMDAEDKKEKKEKVIDQYIGVQLNNLIRQVFNFNNSSAPNTNPYLLNYSINSAKSGWGGRIGIGYTYNSFSTDDGITKTESKINDMAIRLGFEKMFNLSKKWSAGAGLDLVYNNNNDRTTNTINSTFGGQNTDTKSVVSSTGGGPMAWLRYHVTSKILIGTEASFYYVSGKNDQTITISDPGGFNPPVTTPSNNKVGQGNFNSPVVFFLSVKF